MAARDLAELIESHGLPKDAPVRVRRSVSRTLVHRPRQLPADSTDELMLDVIGRSYGL